jgi:hypothetical protein
MGTPIRGVKPANVISIKKPKKKTCTDTTNKNDLKLFDMEYGIVYLLTNPVMPGLVKIGMTAQEDIDKRMKELYTTGQKRA